jgi:hypothetical protein
LGGCVVIDAEVKEIFIVRGSEMFKLILPSLPEPDTTKIPGR